MPSAKKTLRYTEITKETFNTILSHYPSTVPENLRELNALRYDEIPTAVAPRSKNDAFLNKDEVVKLV